jgi:hypothetical protein
MIDKLLGWFERITGYGLDFSERPFRIVPLQEMEYVLIYEGGDEIASVR